MMMSSDRPNRVTSTLSGCDAPVQVSGDPFCVTNCSCTVAVPIVAECTGIRTVLVFPPAP